MSSGNGLILMTRTEPEIRRHPDTQKIFLQSGSGKLYVMSRRIKNLYETAGSEIREDPDF